MKLQNLVACVSKVLSTWQYHELYYIITIVFFFFPQRVEEKGLQVNLPSRKLGNFITMTLLFPWSWTFSFNNPVCQTRLQPFFFLEEKCLQLITNSIAHSRLNLDNLG